MKIKDLSAWAFIFGASILGSLFTVMIGDVSTAKDTHRTITPSFDDQGVDDVNLLQQTSTRENSTGNNSTGNNSTGNNPWVKIPWA